MTRLRSIEGAAGPDVYGRFVNDSTLCAHRGGGKTKQCDSRVVVGQINAYV